MNSRVLLIFVFLFSMVQARSSEVASIDNQSLDYEFIPFKPFYIENLDLGKNSSLNLVVISNGNFVRKMNWLNPLTSSIFDFFSTDLDKTERTNWLIFSAASTQQPQMLIDGRALDKGHDLSLLVNKGKQAVDFMTNTQTNQDLIKLLRSVRDLIENRNMKVDKIVFVISTEWNFSSLFNKGEPDQSMQDLLDCEVKKIHVIQVHESGDFGINKEFDETLRNAELNLSKKVFCHNLPFVKISALSNQLEQGKINKNFILELKKKLTELFKNKIL